MKEVFVDPDDAKEARYSTEMHIFLVLIVKHAIKRQGFQYLQYFKIVIGEQPFNGSLGEKLTSPLLVHDVWA